MKRFAQLFTQLDQTTSSNAKVAALAAYFREAEPTDRLWTIALFSHRRPRRTVATNLLREWAAADSALPLWLFEESYHVVGDLAETIALALPPPTAASSHSLAYWIGFIRQLADLPEPQRQAQVRAAWDSLDYTERFIFNKLITGNFRVGVSQKLMVKALSLATGEDENSLAHRLMGHWDPELTTFAALTTGQGVLDEISKPYPFYLAHPLEDTPDSLGAPHLWQAEYKWDGIRGQVIVRDGQLFVWSRGEELVTDKYPEYSPLALSLAEGAVIDGEILPFRDGRPLSFQLLQTRIGRKNVSRKQLAEAPVVLMAYDLLEYRGEDWRARPLAQRRQQLAQLVDHPAHAGLLLLSPHISFSHWDELAELRRQARQLGSEGLMLKRLDSPYRSGRKRGDWWKWKVDPLTVDAVLIYAQSGHGRRANLYTDFTFAVWNEQGKLTPFTKAYSGLTDAEFQQITTWVRQHTTDRFGPVRAVTPQLVFEIAFEGIQASSRHKSGIALRFPRMVRWRRDKPAAEANTLADLQQMLQQYQQEG